MQVNVTSKDFVVTPSIYRRIQGQLSKLCKYPIHLDTPHIIIKKKNNTYIIETGIQVPHRRLFAQGEHQNLYSAINGMRQKLERQITRYLEKPLANRFVDIAT